jgi:hypothetical protein
MAMLPKDLQPDQFRNYPPEAKKLALAYLDTFHRLPLSFLPNLLRELIDYDFQFPAERQAIDKELANLQLLSPVQMNEWFHGFSQISLSSQLERLDWVNSPAQFVEVLSAHLWTTHQMDAFRQAALQYADRLRRAVPPQAPPVPRLGIAVIGYGVDTSPEELFRKLRPHGAYFTGVNPENGLAQLLDALNARAAAHAISYAHWYVDGGQALAHAPAVTCVSYQALASVRSALLSKMQAETQKQGMGPEALRSLMAQMRPEELGMSSSIDPILARFQVKLLTEGSGTQVFSTSFVQWAAREALRRAQPLTLLVRFAPRQRQKPMNELLSPSHEPAELDPIGSLLDADMGAYYNWINQHRLPGADKSLFLAWFENHNQAIAISPSLPAGTTSTTTATLTQLLSWMS